MATQTVTPSTISGRIASVNEKGFKLEGAESWLNYSKWAEGIVAPERGAVVTATLDKAGFVRSVSSTEPARIAGGSDAPAPSTKDRTITRLAVLKAAAEYSASKPESKSSDVLTIAACWEKWVMRSDEPLPADIVVFDALDETVDAF